MASSFWRAAVLAAATIFASDDLRALSFDERWQSLFAESEVVGDRVSAKAEMVRQADRKIERSTRAQRPRAHRHRHASRRGERRREWYKGGKKWHYVYARRRAR